MSPPVRVMIVDDSSVVRKLLTAALSAHPEIEVVGSAANGVIALHKLPQLNPEAVILDVEMPEMDGITTLANLREHYPRLPVVMFSTLTERGANVTFDALAAGASDYVLKPSTQNGETLESVVGNTLVPKLLALTRSRFGLALQAAIAAAGADASAFDGRRGTGTKPTIGPALKPALGAPSLLAKGLAPSLAPRVQARPSLPNVGGRPSLAAAQPSFAPAEVKKGSSPSQPPGLAGLTAPPAGPARPADFSIPAGQAMRPPVHPFARPAVPLTQAQGRKPVQIIAIAASTGGPNALAEVLPRLPGSLPVPIVIVQHMPPVFTRCLADRLSARCELKILESAGGERLMPGHVYIAPGNRHLELVRDADGVATSLSDGAPENSCRPAADVLFRSVARAYGGAALCAVLTGMGHDGLRGAREIREAGGRVIVQSGPTCVIWGMPKAVEEAGLAEAAVPLSEMAAALLQRVGLGLLPVRAPEGTR